MAHDGLGVTIVTGGASGLGAAVAELVRDEGGTPVVLDVRPPSDGLAFRQVDLARTRDAEEAVRAVEDEHGRIDAVVTAAGVDTPSPFGELPGEEWERILAVNLLGTAAVVRAALSALERSPNGRIVTIGSTLGFRVFPDASAYCASKFGVVGFTRALASELQGRVGVTLVAPGGMRTHFFDAREETYKPAPDAQLNDPRDVARAIVFALRQPSHCEVRELVITPSREPSWP